MRAALLQEFGKPLTIQEVPPPTPGPGQVVLRVEACGVCHSDLHIARGEWERFKTFMSLPIVLGHEVAGRIVEIGSGVTDFRDGDTVGVPWFHHTCGRCNYCRQDLEVFCDTPAITGVTVNGGLAEYVLAWASHAIPIPAEIYLEEAAPLFCAGGTIYSALRKVKLDPSIRVAVWGVGGLGHLAIQLAKHSGAPVTAVDVAADKLDLARKLGAAETIEAHRSLEWFEDPQHQVDVALVCATSIEAYQGALKCLRKNGALLVVGLPSKPLSFLPQDLVRSGARIFPSRVSSRRELRELLVLAAQGAVHSQIRTYPLAEINQVLDLLEAGKVLGRAVIRM